MRIGFQAFILCAVFGASWFTTEPAIARKKAASSHATSGGHSRAWWTNWWLDCQKEGTCEYNGKQYYFDSAAMKVREGRKPASKDSEYTATYDGDESEDAKTPAVEKATVPATTPKAAKKKAAPAQDADDAPDLDAERAEAQANHKRAANAPLPPQNSNCGRELAKSQEALAKYNTCLKQNNLPAIEWGVSGTGFLVDGSRPGRQKKMFAIRDGKCLYEQTVSLGRGSDSGQNGYVANSYRTPAGLFGLTFNTRRGSKFSNKSMILHGGNAADRGIYAHNGPTSSNSIGCIRLGGPLYTAGGDFARMNKVYRTGVNNVFIYFKDAKAPNGGCGSPKQITPRATAGAFSENEGDQQ